MILEIFLLFLNGIAFITFSLDKYLAKKRKWRIREHILLMLLLSGGVIGGMSAMYLFHHKTRKIIFKIGLIIGWFVVLCMIVLMYIKK